MAHHRLVAYHCRGINIVGESMEPTLAGHAFESILMDGERIPQPSADIEIGTGQLVGIVSVDLGALQRAVANEITRRGSAVRRPSLPPLRGRMHS